MSSFASLHKSLNLIHYDSYKECLSTFLCYLLTSSSKALILLSVLLIWLILFHIYLPFLKVFLKVLDFLWFLRWLFVLISSFWIFMWLFKCKNKFFSNFKRFNLIYHWSCFFKQILLILLFIHLDFGFHSKWFKFSWCDWLIFSEKRTWLVSNF